VLELALSADHPDVTVVWNNPAAAAQARGRTAAAERLYRHALRLKEGSLGRDHPDTATTRYNLGTLYEDMGRTTEAADLFREALAVFDRTLGACHPKTAACRERLGGQPPAARRRSSAGWQ
jgi:tetratricopeptide (TPR) repeat protein